MVHCGRCGEEVTDGVKCSVCEKHYDFPCSGVTEAGYRKLGDRQATWKCPSCKTGATPKPSASSPGMPTLDQVMDELKNIKLAVAPLAGVLESVVALKKEISELKSLKTSFEKHLARFDDLEKRLLTVEKAKDEMSELKTRVQQLEEDLNEKNQFMRLNNAEIKGVPMKDHENLFDIIAKIGSKVMYSITKQHINFVARVPSRDNNKPIIVSFLNRYVKEDFVAAARLNKTLNPGDLGLVGNHRIYVNDHLTIQNKSLLTKAKNLAKEAEFEYIWVKNSKIFARKNPQSKVIAIKKESDLMKIV